MPLNVLFHRDYKTFSGGHLKVWDYYQHTRACDRYRAQVYLAPNAAPGAPWLGDPGLVDHYDPTRADILFLAGLDWTALAAHPGIEDRIPVVNLVQGLRHAMPHMPHFGFLSRRATRICVSQAVAEALQATGICNGPIHVIPNGIDFGVLPDNATASATASACDIFISGAKRPKLAAALAARLQAEGYRVHLQIPPLPRPEFLARMARAPIAVLLPQPQEGFYLPALEAMALGRVVICPDCGGNRSFCIDRVTALMPPAALAPLAQAVAEASRSPGLAQALRQRAKEISKIHDIRAERAAFLDLLRHIGPQ